MAGKLPAFLFYPSDWQNDANLKRCSLASQAVWMRMLCSMFWCEERGVLSTGGVPWTDKEIAQDIPGDSNEVLSAVSELLLRGVASRNQAGAIYSRRMVRDETTRKANAVRQSRIRGKTNSNANSNASVTPTVTHKVTALSEDEDETENAVESDFLESAKTFLENPSQAARLSQLFAFHYAGLGQEKNPFAMKKTMQDLLDRGIPESEIEAYILLPPKDRPRSQKEWQFVKRWEVMNDRNANLHPGSGSSRLRAEPGKYARYSGSSQTELDGKASTS